MTRASTARDCPIAHHLSARISIIGCTHLLPSCDRGPHHLRCWSGPPKQLDHADHAGGVRVSLIAHRQLSTPCTMSIPTLPLTLHPNFHPRPSPSSSSSSPPASRSSPRFSSSIASTLPAASSSPPPSPSPSSSPAVSSPSSSRPPPKHRFAWTADVQKFLVELAHGRRIWAASHGTVTTQWDGIADEVSRRAAGRVNTTGRGCREKFEALCREAKARQQSASQRSGDEESWTDVDKMLFDCNDEAASWAAAAQQAREQDEKEAAQRTERQTELKEETMQSLSQRRSRQTRSPVSAAALARVRSGSRAAVDLTDEKVSESADSSESGAPDGRKRRRTDVRSLLRESLDAQHTHFAAQRVSADRQVDAVERYVQHVESISTSLERSLMAQILHKM